MRTLETVEVDYQMLAAMIWDLLRMKAKEQPKDASYFRSPQAIADCIVALRAVRIGSLN